MKYEIRRAMSYHGVDVYADYHGPFKSYLEALTWGRLFLGASSVCTWKVYHKE